MSIKQAIIGKAFVEIFKYGLKNEFPEQVAQSIEKHWDSWMATNRSEKLQIKFEMFLEEFTKRMIKEFRKDR